MSSPARSVGQVRVDGAESATLRDGRFRVSESSLEVGLSGQGLGPFLVSAAEQVEQAAARGDYAFAAATLGAMQRALDEHPDVELTQHQKNLIGVSTSLAAQHAERDDERSVFVTILLVLFALG